MGSGKTAVGERAARQLGLPFADLDTVIELHLGQPIGAVFASRGEAYFRRVEARLLKSVLQPGLVAALGGGTPVPDSNWKVIRRRARTIWLDAPLEAIWGRISTSTGRPLLSGRSKQEVGKLLAARRARYAEADHRVDAARGLDEVVQEVVRIWSG
jgi:shikimate kinase